MRMNFLQKIIFEDNFKFQFTRHLLFWIVIYGYFSSFGFFDHTLSDYLKLNAVFLPSDILITYLFLYIIFPVILYEKRYLKAALYFLILLVVYYTLVRISYLYILPLIFDNYVQLTLLRQILNGSETVLIIFFSAGFLKMIKYWYKVEVDNQKLEKKSIENKMAMLTSQLHPHFLFNTLNNLYTLSKERSEKTSEIILKLSNVMRYILDDYNKLNVGLNKELEIIKSYVEIEKLRYDDDLKVNFDVRIQEKGLKNIQIPPLLIFTFVENAFKHGVSGSLVNPWINILIEKKDDILKILVENSVDEYFNKKAKRQGVGLKNVQKRLELYYPRNYKYVINKMVNKYIVNLEIKLQKYENKVLIS